MKKFTGSASWPNAACSAGFRYCYLAFVSKLPSAVTCGERWASPLGLSDKQVSWPTPGGTLGNSSRSKRTPRSQFRTCHLCRKIKMQDLWVYCVHLLGLWTISYGNPLLASQHAHFSLCDLSRLNRLRRKLIYSEFWFRCWYNFSIVRSDFHFTIVKCALYEWAAIKNLLTIFDFLFFFVRCVARRNLHSRKGYTMWSSIRLGNPLTDANHFVGCHTMYGQLPRVNGEIWIRMVRFLCSKHLARTSTISFREFGSELQFWIQSILLIKKLHFFVPINYFFNLYSMSY